jgi:hypothetical protein
MIVLAPPQLPCFPPTLPYQARQHFLAGWRCKTHAEDRPDPDTSRVTRQSRIGTHNSQPAGNALWVDCARIRRIGGLL